MRGARSPSTTSAPATAPLVGDRRTRHPTTATGGRVSPPAPDAGGHGQHRAGDRPRRRRANAARPRARCLGRDAVPVGVAHGAPTCGDDRRARPDGSGNRLPSRWHRPERPRRPIRRDRLADQIARARARNSASRGGRYRSRPVAWTRKPRRSCCATCIATPESGWPASMNDARIPDAWWLLSRGVVSVVWCFVSSSFTSPVVAVVCTGPRRPHGSARHRRDLWVSPAQSCYPTVTPGCSSCWSSASSGWSRSTIGRRHGPSEQQRRSLRSTLRWPPQVSPPPAATWTRAMCRRWMRRSFAVMVAERWNVGRRSGDPRASRSEQRVLVAASWERSPSRAMGPRRYLGRRTALRWCLTRPNVHERETR